MMGNQGVLFCVVIGLVAYLPEAFLGGVLCDNRAALRRDDLEESVLLEWQFLERLPPSFWRSLAPLVDLCPAALRNMVIKGAAVAWSYLEWRVFRLCGISHGACAVGTWMITCRLPLTWRSLSWNQWQRKPGAF